MGQDKGKGKASDQTPVASGAGGGNPPPRPRKRAAGALEGGGDPDDEGEGSGKKPDESGKGRRDERPTPQPEDNDNTGKDEQFNILSRVMAYALGGGKRFPAEPPALFKNAKDEYIRMWLLTCMQYFGQNSWQWEDEAQGIRYAISRMAGKEVALFALTYQRPMTVALGYTKQAGYEFWHVFGEQGLRRFGRTHGAEKSIREMGFVKYHGDIAKFLLEMENLHIDARVTGIARRKMIEDEIPKDAL